MATPLIKATDVEVVTCGQLPDGIVEYAREKVMDVVRDSPVPIRHARVKLSHAAEPTVSRPAQAKANLDLDGRPLRGQVAAATPGAAVDLLRDRLRARLAGPAAHWPAGPEARPEYAPRPVGQREIIRYKNYPLARMSPGDAVGEMEYLDYDVHLFADAGTGQDAVVYRAGPTGYRLARLRPAGGPRSGVPAGLTVSPHPAPRLTERQAVARLDRTGQPFLFFAGAAGGRGRLLYRRYDGHYGMISPG
jgi:Sigma 54 modulation/S30EA ribosomal protein C terminus